MIEDCKNINALISLFNKIEEMVSVPIALSKSKTATVGLSMGVYLCHIDKDFTPDTLLRYADNALYQSKEYKQDRKCFWTVTDKCS